MSVRITVLGSGGPPPSLERSGPAFVLHLDGRPVLVDCGPGAVRQLLRAGISVPEITQVFFTHLHSDHTLDFGQFVLGGWSLGRRQLQVFGPTGTKHMADVLFGDLWREDIEYRLSLGRSGSGVTNMEIVETRPGVVYEDELCKVTTAEGFHSAYNLAHRFDCDGKTVVFSGDTTVVEAVTDLALGADVLVYDTALVPSVRDYYLHEMQEPKVWESLRKHHSTPEEAGKVAATAGVEKLVLVHLLPMTDPEEAVEEARKEFSGEVLVAEDLMEVSVG